MYVAKQCRVEVEWDKRNECEFNAHMSMALCRLPTKMKQEVNLHLNATCLLQIVFALHRGNSCEIYDAERCLNVKAIKAKFVEWKLFFFIAFTAIIAIDIFSIDNFFSPLLQIKRIPEITSCNSLEKEKK